MTVHVHDIIHAIATHTGTTRAEIIGERRQQPLALYRQLGYLMAYELCPNLSVKAIGWQFKRADHTTILWGVKAARKALELDKKLADWYCALREQIKAGAAMCPDDDERVWGDCRNQEVQQPNI